MDVTLNNTGTFQVGASLKLKKRKVSLTCSVPPFLLTNSHKSVETHKGFVLKGMCSLVSQPPPNFFLL